MSQSFTEEHGLPSVLPPFSEGEYMEVYWYPLWSQNGHAGPSKGRDRNGVGLQSCPRPSTRTPQHWLAPASRWCQRPRWPYREAASLSLPRLPGFPSLPCPLTEMPPEAALSPLQVPDPWSGHQSLNATAAWSHTHRGMLDIASRPVVQSPSVNQVHTQLVLVAWAR